jgi:hypothetical protein
MPANNPTSASEASAEPSTTTYTVSEGLFLKLGPPEKQAQWEAQQEQELKEPPWHYLAGVIAKHFGDPITFHETEYDFLLDGRYRFRGRGPFLRSLMKEPKFTIKVPHMLRMLHFLGIVPDEACKRVKKLLAWRRDGLLPARTPRRPKEPVKPRWDGMILWYGDTELLSFPKKAAPAQEAILAALEKAGWPPRRVAVPQKSGGALRKIINAMNEKIKGGILRLHAGGDGKSVTFTVNSHR